MKKYFSFIKKDFIIFVICCFLSIILFFSRNFSELKLFQIHINNFFSFIFSPKKIANNLLFLESQNDSLINKIKQQHELIDSLKKITTVIPEYSNYDEKLNKLIPNNIFIPAKVLNHSFLNSAHFFNINIGKNDGLISEYRAVINYDGNLVGKTLLVSDQYTQVHKISNKDFHVYVQSKNDIYGQFSYINGKFGIIESVSKKFKDSLDVGDIFFTSHGSKIFPEKIPVAKIVKIDNKLKNHELYIKVEILSDMTNLKNVFVIN